MRFLTDYFFLIFFSHFSRMKFIISLVLLAGSTLLARCDSILKCDADTTTLEVRIAAGQKLKNALVSSPNWGWKKYPNNICKRWHIKAEENQVHFVLIFVGHKSFLWGHRYPIFW